MANVFKLSALIQNTYEGNTGTPKVTHKLPAFSAELSAKESVVLELTGTGVHTLVNDATNWNYNGSILNNPFGEVIEIGSNQILGFALYVTRAATATAPTGHVRLENGGVLGWLTDGHAHLYENALFICHNPSGPTTSDSTGLTIDLSAGTGYKVSVIAYNN
jgi:hypothetical protein